MAYYAREAVPVPVLASVKVPVMILSGALDKVSTFCYPSPGLVSARCFGALRLTSPATLIRTQVSPLAAAESWRAALTSG